MSVSQFPSSTFRNLRSLEIRIVLLTIDKKGDNWSCTFRVYLISSGFVLVCYLDCFPLNKLIKFEQYLTTIV